MLENIALLPRTIVDIVCIQCMCEECELSSAPAHWIFI